MHPLVTPPKWERSREHTPCSSARNVDSGLRKNTTAEQESSAYDMRSEAVLCGRDRCECGGEREGGVVTTCLLPVAPRALSLHSHSATFRRPSLVYSASRRLRSATSRPAVRHRCHERCATDVEQRRSRARNVKPRFVARMSQATTVNDTNASTAQLQLPTSLYFPTS